jgi:PAS domain S-box-containing protein
MEQDSFSIDRAGLGRGGPRTPPVAKDPQPLYNSRIAKVYLEYLAGAHPGVDIRRVLDYAGMSKLEVVDPAHWFTQEQMDRFNHVLVQETGVPNLSREAGRYTVSSEALGAAKQHTLGLLSPMTVFLLMGRLYPIMSRGAAITARKVGPGSVEVVSTPRDGVREQAYQCENRMGTLEALPKWFTGKFGRIEHPECIHRGDGRCRYLISWDRTAALFWRRLRTLSGWAGVPVLAVPLFLGPLPWGAPALLAWLALFASLAWYAERLEKRELMQTVEQQGDAARDLMAEIDTRYNTSLLVKEIGEAASSILEIPELLQQVIRIMEARLDYDRAAIMLADKGGGLLEHVAGYGYTPEEEERLRRTPFHLDDPASRGPMVRAFREQKPFLLNDIRRDEAELSERTRRLIREMGVVSLVCVPLVHKSGSLGVLAVDNVQSKRSLTQSDLDLLMGVASQAAVGVFNAMSYQRLQESEKNYRELVENANSIILRVDTEGRIRFVNEFAQRRLGYEEREMLGDAFLATRLVGGEKARRDFLDRVNALRRRPDSTQVQETESELRSGETVWIAWTYRSVLSETGELEEILCIGNDITELKAAEQDKKQLERQVVEAQKLEAVGTLAGGIAHDFNNILQAILGYTQILLLGKPNQDPDRSKLEAIDRSARRGSELTRQLLLFGRKVESRLRPADLNQEVVQVVEMLERTIPKMIEIQCELGDGLHLIEADTVQLEQIMMNLGVNARDAMPEGGVLRFETANVRPAPAFFKTNEKLSPGDYVMLTVSDTGQGMETETLERIFEPFFSTKEAGQGTGLGLAMVYGIVENHGGVITCESEKGKGTVFRIYFPALESPAGVTEAEEGREPVPGNGETVLLVDDDETVREVGATILRRFGYRVLEAEDGEEALDLYDRERGTIDLIVLDWIMPGIGGEGCMKGILERNPSERIVIASGYSLEEPAREGRIPAASIRKPYDVGQMLEVIRKALQG